MKILQLAKISGRTCLRALSLVLVLLGTGLAVMPLIGQTTAAPDNDHDGTALIGTVTGTIPVDFGPPVPGTGGCVFEFTVPNSGTSNVLGPFTGTAVFRPNVCDGSYTGSYDWHNSRGDRMTGPFMGQNLPTATQGVFLNNENAVITGGAGILKHATGMFQLFGTITFFANGGGTFTLPFEGLILKDH
ncbi:MAG: hypothetical protein ACXWFY_04130 [Chthoniobacterales bacterium]